MKLLTTFRRVCSQKVALVLAVPVMLGLMGLILVPTSTALAASTAYCKYYTVKSGDTLSQIAANYHSSVGAIGQANHIPNINLIYPNQRFCIPDGYATVSQPAPAQHTSSRPQGANSSSVAGMIDQIFGPYASGAINVARCESGLNSAAYNPISIGGSHAAGVFQILYPSTWSGTPYAASSPYNAWANIQAAHAIFVRDGYSWREWTCQP